MGNKEVPPTIDIAMAANHGDSLTLTPWQVKWLDDWQSTTLVQFARFERIEQAAKKLITCLPFADNEVGHKETADGMRDAITELERLESFQGCDGCSTGDCPHDNVNDCVQSQATTIAAQAAELERLRGMEEKLAKTADGVAVVKGDRVYVFTGVFRPQKKDVVEFEVPGVGKAYSVGEPYPELRADISVCYSTREAAEAAKEAADDAE